MALTPLTAAAIRDLPYYLQEWLRQIQALVGGAVGSIPWASVSKTGSNLTDIATRAHNNLQSLQGGTAGEYYHLTSAEYTALSGLASGEYTPTITNTTNISSSTAYVTQYLRVGSRIHVSGKLDITVTAETTASEFGISLPVASNLALVTDLSGAISSNKLNVGIFGDAVNDRAKCTFTSADTGSQTLYFQFLYKVI